MDKDLEFKFPAVLLECRGYKVSEGKKGAGEQRYQYKFSIGKLSFSLLGREDMSHKVSDLTNGKVAKGTLVVQLAVFEDRPYFQFVAFEL